MAARGWVSIERELCKSCRLCVEHCPKGALRLSHALNEKGYYPVEPSGDSCNGCAVCALVCPEAGIEVWRE
jgi:2-oxoglutarate ferredoxin oxidoreductase subunit delta